MADNNRKLDELKNYLLEPLSPNMGYYFKSGEKLFSAKTKFQDLEVHDFTDYGRVLRLDGVFQTSDRDEFLYHEPLAHVPGIAMGGPKKALVIGGGDGGMVEELLKYPTLEKAVMVELDEGVVDASKKYLPKISNGVFDSPKMELLIEDGVAYIQNTKEKFDQVILDLTDPMGPSAALYTKEFYTSINSILNPGGALSLHIESPVTRPDIFGSLFWTLKSVFQVVRPMLNYVPLYGTLWGYASASQTLDPLQLTPQEVRERLERLGIGELQFYNENTHFSLMALPNYVKDILAKERPPYTADSLPDVSDDLDTDIAIGRPAAG